MTRSSDVLLGAVIGTMVTVAALTFVLPGRRRRRCRLPGDEHDDEHDNDDNDDNKDDDLHPRTRTLMRGRLSLSKKSNHHASIDLSQQQQQQTSFLTLVLEQLWGHVKVASAAMIRDSVEPSFADLPGPLQTCQFVTIDLGTTAPTLDNIVVHPIQLRNDNVLQFDLDVVFRASDCNIQLKADYLGKFGVKNIQLKGRMGIWMKPLMDEMPCVSGIQYAFLNPPELEIDFTGLASVADLGILQTTVKLAIQSSLATVVVLPNCMLYKMVNDNNFLETYHAPLGVARVTLVQGAGFQVERKLVGKDDIPDVYCNITKGTSGVWRTKTIKDNCNPVWKDECGDFLLWDKEELLSIHAWDDDGGRLDADDELGIAKVSLADILASPRRTTMVPLQLWSPKKQRNVHVGATITVQCDVLPFTPNLSSLSQSSNTRVHQPILGMLVVVINRAWNLPLDDPNKACTYVQVQYGKNTFDSTMVYFYPGVDTINPSYDSGFSIPITPDCPRGDDASITLTLIDSSSSKKIALLGASKVTFGEIKKQPNNILKEAKRSMGTTASLEVSLTLCGVVSPTK